MTEPSSARPVPGPPRPGPAAGDGRLNSGAPADSSTAEESDSAVQPSPNEATQSEAPSFGDLGQRPVAEHVGVFEAEHARLQRELGTIDQL